MYKCFKKFKFLTTCQGKTPDNVQADNVLDSVTSYDQNGAVERVAKIPLTQKGNEDPLIHTLALIINVHIYDKEGYTRIGSQVDVDRCVKTLQKFNIGIFLPDTFNRRIYLKDIEGWIEEFKSKFTTCTKTSLVLLMGHGVPGHFVDSCGQFLPIEENIFNQFNNQNFTVMKGRPKLFFMNICRGDTPSLNSPLEPMDNQKDDFNNKMTEPRNDLNDLDCTDMLIFWSTIPGHVSLRSGQSGSRFIKSLCESLNEYLNSNLTDENERDIRFVDILQNVTIKMTHFRRSHDQIPSEVKQSSCIELRDFKSFTWNINDSLYNKKP